jgi:hypothetical protein
VAAALIKLQKEVKTELKSTARRNGLQEKTSVIGGSSIVTSYKAEGSQRRIDLDRRRLEAEQERIAHIFER